MFLEPGHNASNKSGTASNALTAEEHRQRLNHKRRLVRTGQLIMAIGAVIGIVHWLTHIGVFGAAQPPLWLDLLAGYPMAALLIIVGAMIAGKK